jgi:hypothetical protein
MRALLLLFFATGLLAQDFDPQTLVLKNHQLSKEFLAPPQSLVAFRTGLGRYRQLLNWNEGMLQKLDQTEIENKERGQFKLESFTTLLGVSVSGTLGVVNFGGQARTSLFWKKYPEQTTDANVSESELEEDASEFDLYGNENDLKDYFERILNQVLAQESIIDLSTHKIDHGSVWGEFKRMLKVAREIDRHELIDWDVRDLGFEIGVGVKVQPGVVLVSLGGDLRLRFQWSHKLKYLVLRPREKRVLFASRKRQDFLKQTAALEKTGYHLAQLRLGLTADAKGDVAVAELSGLASVYVWLVPKFLAPPEQSTAREIALIKGTHWNRVLKKIIKKSASLTKRAARINSRKKPGDWGVSRVKVFASAGVGASAGVLSVTGTPNIEVDFDHQAWSKKTIVTGESHLGNWNRQDYAMESGWQFSTLRVRTRFRAGVAVPWLAELSFRPMVEFFFK